MQSGGVLVVSFLADTHAKMRRGLLVAVVVGVYYDAIHDKDGQQSIG